MLEPTAQHSQLDLARAAQRLREETDLLCALDARGGLSQRAPTASFEVEAYLIDRTGRAAPQGGALVAEIHAPTVAAGRTAFQVLLRVGAQPIAADGVARLLRDLQSTQARCQEAAQAMSLRLLAIGILPTVDDADLAAHHMTTECDRAAASATCRIEIEGIRERLATEHRGIVAAAAATSLRAHLQVAPEVAARFYNASTIAAFATTGLAANSPYLFGAELWEDTRLALLEEPTAPPPQFIASAEEYFRANLEHPVVTVATADAPHRFTQLRRHNKNLPRFTHLQVGCGDAGAPHLRIEQRAMAPGPTPADTLANLAFHFGLTASLATEPDPPEARIDPATAHANLLAVARGGMNAEIAWLDRERMPLRTLAIVELIERAYEGLHQLGVDEKVAQRNLSLIERRVANGQTGAVWQRRFVHAHGRNFGLLVREYAARQLGGAPVHEWNLRRLT
jgi:gamma-glutamyl:cysteine ligase YbdK (ATP-grasp superfamily)